MVKSLAAYQDFIIKYKIILILFILQGVSIKPYAQMNDSLIKVIRQHVQNDSIKVNLLTKLALTYSDGNKDSIYLLGNKALEISKTIHYELGYAKSFNVFGLYCLRQNNLDSSLMYYQKAYDIYQKYGDVPAQGKILLSMADDYYRQTKYGLALEFYQKGILIFEKTNNEEQIGLAYISIGGIYSDLGNNPDAINNYLKALNIFDRLNIKYGSSMCLSNLALIYSYMHEFSKSIEYINKCLLLEKNSKNKEATLSNYMNAGIVYGQMNILDSSLSFFNKAKQLSEVIGDNEWRNTALVNIAEVEIRLGNSDKAMQNYKEALRDTLNNKEDALYITAYNGIGKLLLEKGETKKSVKIFLKCFEIAKRTKNNVQLFTTSQELSNAYEKMGDYKDALIYQKLFSDYNDSLFNEKNAKRIQQIQFDYELEKKQKQIELLNMNKELWAKNEAKNKILLIGLIFGIVGLTIIIYIMYRSKKSEAKSKIALYEQKEEIQLQANKLDALNKFKDKTFSVISHDLRGPINSIATAFNLLDEKIISEEEFYLMRPDMNKKLRSLNLLLENLLNWAKGYMQGINIIDAALVNLYELANKNISILQSEAKEKNIELINSIPFTLLAKCDAGQLDIVMRNLVVNAIKFTNANGKIILEGINTDKEVGFSVADTGVGMNPEKLGKLFKIAPNLSTYGTSGEKGIGLGLLLCYDFVKANNGTITVQSELSKGTTFTVLFPK